MVDRALGMTATRILIHSQRIQLHPLFRGVRGFLLKVGMVIAVGRLELLEHHAEEACSVPKVDGALHQPGCCGMAQCVDDDVVG